MANIPISFLGLPPHVRARVYRFAGLTRGCPIDLVNESNRHDHLKRTPNSLTIGWELRRFHPMESPFITQTYSRPCLCPSLPYQLLRVCRAIYDEVLPILYSENVFKLILKCNESSPQFGTLLNLNGRAWASFRSLHVGLTAGRRSHFLADTSCPGKAHSAEACRACEPKVPSLLPGHGLGCGESAERVERNDGWDANDVENITQPLGHIPDPSSVDFAPWESSLDSDWVNANPPLDFPEEEIEQLDYGSSKGFLRIREWSALCHLMEHSIQPNKLSLSFNCHVSDLETAKAALKPLQRLPILTNCAIHLGYLDDGTLKDKARSEALRLCGLTNRPSMNGSFSDLPKELRLKFLAATDLVNVSRHSKIDIHDGRICSGNYTPVQCCMRCSDSLSICCCMRFSDAFSTQCACPSTPYSLFLVNRRMHDEAQEVFYTMNRFVCRGDFALTSRWILQLPAEARALMRNLNLTLNHQEILGIASADPNYQIAWQELVEVIGKNLAQEKLTLTLCANRRASDRHSLEEHNRPKFLQLKAAYGEMLRPVKRHFQRLKDFYLYLEGFEEHETGFEKKVMGKEYHSDKRGKPLASPDERQLLKWQDSESE